MDDAIAFKNLESLTDHAVRMVGSGLLAGLVLVRTFLSWTLVLEIEGRWPWQREPSPMSSRVRPGGIVEAR